MDDDVEERMRQFTVVLKVGIQTGCYHRGIPKKGHPSFLRISREHFNLTQTQYYNCRYKAHKMLEKISMGLGLTSDDMIRSSLKEAA